MSTIYLIRHGEIPQARPHRFVGQQDLPLTDNGRAQLGRVALFLASRAVDRVITSPLARCRQSSEIICKFLGLCPARPVSELREIGLGAWEGQTVAEVRARFPGEYEARGRDIAGFRPYGGESFADLLHRAWPAWLSATGKADERLAIVAHAGVNRVLLCRILGMPLENLFLLEQDLACVNILQREDSCFRLQGLNIRP